MSEKMLVTQALDERDLLVKKISDKIDKASFVDTIKPNEDKVYSKRIPLVPHRAKQITLADYDKFDYIIGMDTANMRNLNRMLKGDPEGKVYKFLTFAGSGRDIADPWYTGNFDITYDDVVEGCDGFLAYLKENGEI